MEKEIRFFKQDSKWYADVPNHSLEENEMVMGADIALDYISNGKEEVLLTVTDEYPGYNAPLELTRKEHDDEGAYYTVSGLLFLDFMISCSEMSGNMPMREEFKPEIWICNVTHDIFGEHPKNIYVLKIV